MSENDKDNINSNDFEFLDNEDIKFLSNNKDKNLISSKEFSKSFENFVIKTIVNKHLIKNEHSKSPVKKILSDEMSERSESKQKRKKEKSIYKKSHSKEVAIDKKKSIPLKSVVATSKLSYDDERQLISVNKVEKYGQYVYSSPLRKEDEYRSDSKLYNRRPIFENKQENSHNKSRKRTIGSLMDKYDDIKSDYNDKFFKNYKDSNNKIINLSFKTKLSNSKSKSPLLTNKTNKLNNLKLRFEDDPIENNNFADNKHIYSKNRENLKLYSEHDDRFFAKNSASLTTKNPDSSILYSNGLPYKFKNYSNSFHYPKNPEIYSNYYNSSAYYYNLYQLNQYFTNKDSYYHQFPSNSATTSSAIYGGIADFEDNFKNKSESIVKSKPGEHISYNNDYTSISLKYDQIFDSDDNDEKDVSSNTDHEARKRSRKKKSKKSKRRSKKKRKNKRKESTDFSESSHLSDLSSDYDYDKDYFKPMLVKPIEENNKKSIAELEVIASKTKKKKVPTATLR